jgi:hypothetical protein
VIFDGLPDDDVAAATRVLNQILDQARAVLAANVQDGAREKP